jgi:hypothetical protein
MLTRLSALVEVTCAKEEGNYVRFIFFCVYNSLLILPRQMDGGLEGGGRVFFFPPSSFLFTAGCNRG